MKLTYVLMMLLLSVATLEVGARVLQSNSQHDPDFLTMGRGFNEFEQLLADIDTCSQSKYKYYDHFTYSPAPCETKTINIKSYYSSRHTPASSPDREAELTIWMFGGSALKQWSTTDELTIANIIAGALRAQGLNVKIENFGVGSYQSTMELIKFITIAARVERERLPHVVVFYHGGNDASHGMHFGAGAIQNDLSQKLAHLVESKSGTLTLYSASRFLSRHSVFWSSYIHPHIERALFTPPEPQYDLGNLERSIDIYVRNTQIAEAVCASIGAKCFFVLQPLLVTKATLGPIEQTNLAEIKTEKLEFVRDFYAGVKEHMQGNPSFLDATGALDEIQADMFYDFFHTSLYAGQITGRYIAGALAPHLPPLDHTE